MKWTYHHSGDMSVLDCKKLYCIKRHLILYSVLVSIINTKQNNMYRWRENEENNGENGKNKYYFTYYLYHIMDIIFFGFRCL